MIEGKPLLTVYPASGVSLGSDGLVGEIYESEIAQNDFVAVLQFLAIHSLTFHVSAVQATGVNHRIISVNPAEHRVRAGDGGIVQQDVGTAGRVPRVISSSSRRLREPDTAPLVEMRSAVPSARRIIRIEVLLRQRTVSGGSNRYSDSRKYQ